MKCSACYYYESDIRFFLHKFNIGKHGISYSGYFDYTRNARLKYYRKYKYGKNDKSKIMAMIDQLSAELIKVRNYEATLPPAIFTKSSYT